MGKNLSVKDFVSVSSIDAAINDKLDCNINKSDSNGFTPLCFVVLNGIKTSLEDIDDKGKEIENPKQINTIDYLIKKKADVSFVCDRGKSPIQYACLAMDANAVEEIFEACEKEKLDCKVYGEDLLSAAILPKEDIFKSLLDKYTEYNNINTIVSVKDSHGNNVMLLATLAQCYGTVDLLLDKITDETKSELIYSFNKEGKSAYIIASENKDEGLLDKYSKVEPTLVADSIAKGYRPNQLDNIIYHKLYAMLEVLLLKDKVKLSDKHSDGTTIEDLAKNLSVEEAKANSKCYILLNVYLTSTTNEDVKDTICNDFASDKTDTSFDYIINNRLYKVIDLLYNKSKFSESQITSIKNNTELDNNKLPQDLKHSEIKKP